MKKIFSTIVISFICLISISQTFEWKRMSGTITDTSYESSATTTNMLIGGSNYYFAYQVGPLQMDNYPYPPIWLDGSMNPVILANNNQLIFADTIINDSVNIADGYFTSFIQNDTFRILVNYPYLDSADFAGHTMYHHGLPVPRCKGFLLINYSLTGGFLGYDSLALPPVVGNLANLSGAAASYALYVKDLFVNSHQEVFVHLGHCIRGGNSGGTYPLDTVDYIIKYNSDFSVSNNVIPVLLKNKDCDYSIDLKLHNDNLFLFGDITDSVIVGNMLYKYDVNYRLNTFAIEFDRNFFVVQNHRLPGYYDSFIIDESGNIYTLGRCNDTIAIGNDTIYPKQYYDSGNDTTYNLLYGLVNKLDNNFNPQYFSWFTLPFSSDGVFMSNGNRVFIKNFFSGYDTLIDNYPGSNSKTNLSIDFDTIPGMFYFKNGDSLVSMLIKHFSDNLVLLSSDNLVPIWDYNFPSTSNVYDINFNSNKMLVSFNGSNPYIAGFGDTDTLHLSGYYDPVVLAQISITGLSIEENEGSESAPLVVYPNPATDQLLLKLPENNNFVVSVFDLNGKLQIEKYLYDGESILNISVLNTGLYIIRAQNEKQILTGKFLKE